jgi:hypothetical protein
MQLVGAGAIPVRHPVPSDSAKVEEEPGPRIKSGMRARRAVGPRRANPVSSVGLAPAGRPFDCLPRQALRTGLARVRRLGSPPAAPRLEQQRDDDDDDDQRAEAQGDVAAHAVLHWLRRCNASGGGGVPGAFRRRRIGSRPSTPPAASLRINLPCGQDAKTRRRRKGLFAQRRGGAESAQRSRNLVRPCQMSGWLLKGSAPSTSLRELTLSYSSRLRGFA